MFNEFPENLRKTPVHRTFCTQFQEAHQLSDSRKNLLSSRIYSICSLESHFSLFGVKTFQSSDVSVLIFPGVFLLMSRKFLWELLEF